MVRFFIFLGGFLLICSTSSAAEQGSLRDPLRPLHYSAPTAEADTPAAQEPISFRLGAVLSSAERTVAVINGKALQVGDVLDGYRLMTIEPSAVLLQKNQKKIVLRRSGTGLKKAVPARDVVEGSLP